jgi:hypothetical protein
MSAKGPVAAILCVILVFSAGGAGGGVAAAGFDLGFVRSGRILQVPSDYGTIAAAVAAADGDTIQVGPGNFSETLSICRSIKLAGAGRQETVIQGSVRLGSAVDLEDLSIDGTLGAEGMGHTTLRWRNCEITARGGLPEQRDAVSV